MHGADRKISRKDISLLKSCKWKSETRRGAKLDGVLQTPYSTLAKCKSQRLTIKHTSPRGGGVLFEDPSMTASTMAGNFHTSCDTRCKCWPYNPAILKLDNYMSVSVLKIRDHILKTGFMWQDTDQVRQRKKKRELSFICNSTLFCTLACVLVPVVTTLLARMNTTVICKAFLQWSILSISLENKNILLRSTHFYGTDCTYTFFFKKKKDCFVMPFILFHLVCFNRYAILCLFVWSIKCMLVLL